LTETIREKGGTLTMPACNNLLLLYIPCIPHALPSSQISHPTKNNDFKTFN
jgi:hypothetical protein